MAGGVGSRFWPMSTEETPKQFIDVLGVGKTLIQLTMERFRGICPPENVWVVTNARYVSQVHAQLPEVPMENILSEPCRRNTAPCICYVSWRIKKKDPKANIVVTPSDHLVANPQEFRRVITQCLKFTGETDAIVTLGMKPTRPETGYGYIQADLSTSSPRNKEIFRVDRFREKPNLETAQKYIQESNFFWNAGPPRRRCRVSRGPRCLSRGPEGWSIHPRRRQSAPGSWGHAWPRRTRRRFPERPPVRRWWAFPWQQKSARGRSAAAVRRCHCPGGVRSSRRT